MDGVELRRQLTLPLEHHRGEELIQLLTQAGLLDLGRLVEARARSSTRASVSARLRTSRGNTTAAAGAPPMTDAYVPRSAIARMLGLSALENTTYAPPW